MRSLVKSVLSEDVAQRNSTVLLTSHNLRELEDLCDHMGLLVEGRIMFESDIDSLKTEMFKVQIALPDKTFDRDELQEKRLDRDDDRQGRPRAGDRCASQQAADHPRSASAVAGRSVYL